MNDRQGHPAAPKGSLNRRGSDRPLSVAMIGPVPAHWGGQKWTGGVATYVQGLTRAFQGTDIQISLLADNMDHPFPDGAANIPDNLQITPGVIPFSRSSAVLWPRIGSTGWRILRSPYLRQAAPPGYLLRIWWRAANIQSFLEKNDSQLIHVHHARFRLFACREILQLDRPLVTTVQSVNLLQDDSPPWLKNLVITNYQRADWFIAVSGFVRDEMVAHGADPAKITVIPNGVDTDLFVPGSKEAARDRLQLPGDSLLVLFTGSLTVRKGVDILVRAFKPLAARYPNARLVLVGEGPERGSLLRLAQELGVADRVIFAGAKPYPTLPAWYQASDIYVLPSWAEGLSLALLEAMASGLPVISTSPARGDHDAVRPGETGLLFERGNPNQLAQLLLSLAADRERQQELGQAARKRVEAEFTWESIAQRTRSVYDNLPDPDGLAR